MLTVSNGADLVVPVEMVVGERVRLARLAAGMTRQNLAEAIGVSHSTLQRIEDGSREPRRGELVAIAHFTRQELLFFDASLAADEGGVLPPPLPHFNEDGP